MKKYSVTISWEFTVDGYDPIEARDTVVQAIDQLLPGDNYILGETVSAEDIVDDTVEEIEDDD